MDERKLKRHYNVNRCRNSEKRQRNTFNCKAMSTDHPVAYLSFDILGLELFMPKFEW